MGNNLSSTKVLLQGKKRIKRLKINIFDQRDHLQIIFRFTGNKEILLLLLLLLLLTTTTTTTTTTHYYYYYYSLLLLLLTTTTTTTTTTTITINSELQTGLEPAIRQTF